MRLLFLIILSISVFSVNTKSENDTRGAVLVKEALSLFEKEDFAQAMKLFTKSLEVSEAEKDYTTYMISTGYISNIYFNCGDYGRCIFYEEKGYEVAVKQKDKEMQSKFLTNIVAAYCKSGNPVKAKEYFELLKKTPGQDRINWNYYLIYNEARISLVENKTQKALELHKRALLFAQQNKMDTEYALFQICEIGSIYYLMGDYDKAIEFAKRCIAPAKKINERDLLTSVYKLLGDAYAMKGDSTESTNYTNMYHALQDSIFNRKSFYLAGNELMEYENRQTNKHINSLTGTINKQIIIILIVSVLLVALTLLSFMLIRSNRRLKTAQRLLINKNKELAKSEKHSKELLEQWLEKDTLEEAENNGIVMSKEQTNRLLNKIIEVMNNIEIISNPDFNLNMLTELVESNTKYVSWVINDTYNKNFKTLLNECRIREACKRLSDTDNYGNITIQAIFYEVGYKNAVSFIRAFKKVNGMTPSEFQKLSKEEKKENE